MIGKKHDYEKQNNGRASNDKISQRSEAWRLFLNDVHYNLRNTSFKKKASAFGKLLILLLIIIGLPVVMFLFGKDTIFNVDYLSQLPYTLAEHKVLAFLILVFLQMLQIIICFIPGQPIQFASSYLFGIFGGYLISLIGAIIGSIITFKIAEILGSDAMHLLFGENRVKDYMNKLNSGKALIIILLIYMIPGIPKDLVSYVAGISEIRLRPFLIFSTLGRTPGLLESLLIGYFWAQKNYVGVAIVAIVAVTILAVCIKYRKQLMNFIDSYEDKHDKHTDESA
jgi:uncharacterized membrane protein YdjX (TVP38/TMEM64 family)